MKMERRHVFAHQIGGRWFPYLDKFSCGGGAFLNSGEVLEAVDPYIMDVRKDKFRKMVKIRATGCVWWLKDWEILAMYRRRFGLRMRSGFSRFMWYPATPKCATAFEVKECFEVLKSRGYQSATTYLATDAVSIYDMNWCCPTAIVVGNENRGISDEALALSDLHCSIPMNGMVDFFNVSVAAGLLMHHAVCDRTSRLGSHGDLTFEESQILLAEFSLRHSKSSISIAREYAKRKGSLLPSKI